ncbi:hypothetical protein B0H67DRAFT_208102 [Lasiosphaeris hirsuta]|uniref:Uncharacterized protein n=1 Tax=Lasiosphaeris hirsuta TaxID=260670 RepID=A0AA40AS12_9PEZI|nr:hypothetical protein B0H67DRAFT_208102 [Lasiosphaeris hirsuta]
MCDATQDKQGSKHDRSPNLWRRNRTQQQSHWTLVSRLGNFFYFARTRHSSSALNTSAGRDIPWKTANRGTRSANELRRVPVPASSRRLNTFFDPKTRSLEASRRVSLFKREGNKDTLKNENKKTFHPCGGPVARCGTTRVYPCGTPVALLGWRLRAQGTCIALARLTNPRSLLAPVSSCWRIRCPSDDAWTLERHWFLK